MSHNELNIDDWKIYSMAVLKVWGKSIFIYRYIFTNKFIKTGEKGVGLCQYNCFLFDWFFSIRCRYMMYKFCSSQIHPYDTCTCVLPKNNISYSLLTVCVFCMKLSTYIKWNPQHIADLYTSICFNNTFKFYKNYKHLTLFNFGCRFTL